MKKQVWRKNRSGNEEWQEVNLSANRICHDYIKKNIGRRKFSVDEIEKGLGISRQQAHNWLLGLKRSKDLNSKKPKGERRWYQLNDKGAKRKIRKKGIPKQPESTIKEVSVEVEKEKIVEDKEYIYPLRRI